MESFKVCRFGRGRIGLRCDFGARGMWLKGTKESGF